MLKQRIAHLSKAAYPYALSLRNDFHQHPELGFQEVKTARRVAQELERLGIACRAGYGARTSVLATIHGSAPGPCVLLRADMDALPILEATRLPFRSKNPGVMHACGHDGNMAGLLGVARVLQAVRSEFSGTVKLAFEPGAENGGAAQAMIQAGALLNPTVDAAFCCHFFGSIKEGEIAIPQHYAFAACDTVTIHIYGKGGHASKPHLAIDPVAIAGQLITTVQSNISRSIAPTEIGILTFSTIHGGELFNVIPDQVVLTGSIRNLSPQVRMRIHQVLEGMLDGLTKPVGASYKVAYTNSLPATVNNPALAQFVEHSLQQSLEDRVVYLRNEPELASETFSYFSLAVPSCYFLIGVEAEGLLPPGSFQNHSSVFDWNPQLLRSYIHGMSQLTVDYLTKAPPVASE